MKCSRKTEDVARKIVGWALGILLLVVVVVLLSIGFYYVPSVSLTVLVIFGGSIFLSVLLDWLTGGFNFCDKDDE